jgi:Zn-finger nucleic acid-binding protein
MNLAQYQKVSGIVVHQCMTCGIWLDGANAAKFYSLFEQGRMADLEQRAARVTTEELEARLTKLERRQDLPPAPIVGSEPEVVRDLSAVLVFDFLSFLGSLF